MTKMTGPALASVRGYRPRDLDSLHAICLRTADNGGDATGLFRDPELPGQVYAAPYVAFEPSLAFVAEDGAGVGGYIVAALDTLAFESCLERDWWPALRARYPEPPPDQAERMPAPERYALHDIHHPFGAPPQIVGRFPSHLHVNLLPRLQGRGVGRRLMATLLSNLRHQGSRGVHLLVGQSNQRAVDFYRHVGFDEFPASNVHIFGMDLRDDQIGSLSG